MEKGETSQPATLHYPTIHIVLAALNVKSTASGGTKKQLSELKKQEIEFDRGWRKRFVVLIARLHNNVQERSGN